MNIFEVHFTGSKPSEPSGGICFILAPTPSKIAEVLEEHFPGSFISFCEVAGPNVKATECINYVKPFQPTQFHYHEVVHTASLILDTFSSHITDHVLLQHDTELSEAAKKAEAALAEFYQVAGSAMFNRFKE